MYEILSRKGFFANGAWIPLPACTLTGRTLKYSNYEINQFESNF